MSRLTRMGSSSGISRAFFCAGLQYLVTKSMVRPRNGSTYAAVRSFSMSAVSDPLSM
jgi:hypothetical protein